MRKHWIPARHFVLGITAHVLVAAVGVLAPQKAWAAGPAVSAARITRTFDVVTSREIGEWRRSSIRDSRSSSDRAQRAKTCSAPKFLANANGPSIVVIRPALNGSLTRPFDIELKFFGADGIEINPETFRVCYLLPLLETDVTDRVRPHASITTSGLLARGASFPRGQHRLRLLIDDTQGRVGATVVEFKVR